jgi:colanic acid biosynthesis glycosyl transferase WcaI
VKILLLTNLFWPDELAGASLYTDMALYFKKQGFDVRVFTTFSYYPSWALRPEDKGVQVRDELWNGIPVRRGAMYVPAQPSGLKRMLSDLSFFTSILRNQYRDGWIPDLVLTAEPMFSQCLAQRFLYWGKNIPRIIIVQDFVVDAALELGILKIPGLGIPLRWLERWSLRSASTLTTISRKMLTKLQGIVGPDKRVVYIPNWIHESLSNEITRQQKSPPLRKKNTLLYSGNLGVKQGLQRFIKDFSESQSAWSINIHGGGAELTKLQDELKSHENIHLSGLLDEKEYVDALLSCSACLITQMPGVGANFLPSKLLPALASGTPVLAICDPDSPLGVAVREGGFGSVVKPDAEDLKKTLDLWSKCPELLEMYSRNAKLNSSFYSREGVLAVYEKELRKLIGSNFINN